MIRISASDLESWRYWRDGDYPLDDLVAHLRHTAPPTDKMEAGRAFAKLMETAADGIVDDATVDGWTFVFDDLDAELVRAPVREIKAERIYATPHGPVTLVAKADGVDGRTVFDQKLSERWDAEKYLDSLQWRAYLELFEADTFVYDVFVGRYETVHARSYYDDFAEADQIVRIVDYHRMAFYRYPALAQDVERAVCDLARVIAEYVPELVTHDIQQSAG